MEVARLEAGGRGERPGRLRSRARRPSIPGGRSTRKANEARSLTDAGQSPGGRRAGVSRSAPRKGRARGVGRARGACAPGGSGGPRKRPAPAWSRSMRADRPLAADVPLQRRARPKRSAMRRGSAARRRELSSRPELSVRARAYAPSTRARPRPARIDPARIPRSRAAYRERAFLSKLETQKKTANPARCARAARSDRLDARGLPARGSAEWSAERAEGERGVERSEETG